MTPGLWIALAVMVLGLVGLAFFTWLDARDRIRRAGPGALLDWRDD